MNCKTRRHLVGGENFLESAFSSSLGFEDCVRLSMQLLTFTGCIFGINTLSQTKCQTVAGVVMETDH